MGIAAQFQSFRRQFDLYVRRDTLSFQQSTLPGQVGGDRQAKNLAVADCEDAAAEEASGSRGSYDCGEIVFLGERGDHLAGAGGVLIDKDYDALVEFLRS